MLERSFNLSKSGNILFRSIPNGNWLFSSASLSLIGDNSLVHELRVMASVKLHVNATCYAQHPALKSVYGKSHSVLGGKLFSSCRRVFELAQGLRDSKTSDLNCSPRQSICIIFMCSFIIISFRKVHTSVL